MNGDGLKALFISIGLAILIVVGLFFIPVPAPAQTPSVTLEWAAPGDDGTVGTASLYEAKMSTIPVGADTLAWWNAATSLTGLPVPAVAGTRQTYVVNSGLSFAATYFFIIRARDDGLPQGTNPAPIPNWSGWSNVATKNTGPAPDTTPPSRVIDLIAR